jgi:hypothetical protein
MVGARPFYRHARGCKMGGEIVRLGAGDYRGCRRWGGHNIYFVEPETSSTETVKSQSNANRSQLKLSYRNHH